MKLSVISVAISLAIVLLSLKNGSADNQPTYTTGTGNGGIADKNDDSQHTIIALNTSTSAQSSSVKPDINIDDVKLINYTAVDNKTDPQSNSTVAPTTIPTSSVTTVAPAKTTTTGTTINTTTNGTVTNATTLPTPTVKPEPTQPTTSTSQRPTVTSATPIIETSTQAIPKDRRFDGPSFIGGIVLSFGTVAIAFVAFKFYKARTERNYHTL